jgi:hypothetical protein
LVVPASEIDLAEVADLIGGGVRPSLKDWRRTSLDPDLEQATISVAEG